MKIAITVVDMAVDLFSSMGIQMNHSESTALGNNIQNI